jgi:hypothetical protein
VSRGQVGLRGEQYYVTRPRTAGIRIGYRF